MPVKMVLAAALDPRTKSLLGIRPEQHDLVYAELRAALLATPDVYTAAEAPAAAAATTAVAVAAAAGDDEEDDEPSLFAALGASVPATAAARPPQVAARTAQIDHELTTLESCQDWRLLLAQTGMRCRGGRSTVACFHC
jgi:hypothetical protein